MSKIPWCNCPSEKNQVNLSFFLKNKANNLIFATTWFKYNLICPAISRQISKYMPTEYFNWWANFVHRNLSVIHQISKCTEYIIISFSKQLHITPILKSTFPSKEGRQPYTEDFSWNIFISRWTSIFQTIPSCNIC